MRSLLLVPFAALAFGAAIPVIERGDGVSSSLVSRDYDSYAVVSTTLWTFFCHHMLTGFS
jgi:hypothetical protein